ncbi:methyltransferase family protein [Maribacter arenosus]|uniref:Isoprenylcysteine carboxylmethyltransferase family protein n=1 Tax=Maribacter arenosus TaxID=1854708 RepID=A0ABR7V712_9FLAO|nr:isoprenylcysteine carboxylmethyltransferase family protein [Maribacter arenosus]MBD0849081.1 isoprenylcysteine carboxylmethyltransferase family protein [Maribacter arenosus]
MKLKLPPVLVFVIFSILMYVLSLVLPFGDFEFFGREVLILFLLGMGALVGLISLIQFYIARTSIDPRTPSKASDLVTNGLYRFSRNPMYLALLMVLLAWGLWLGNAFNTLLAAGFVAYLNKFQIIPEEKILSDIYGKAYRHYCTQVRRWF